MVLATKPRYQQAYDLRERGLPFREIAERMGGSESTARRRWNVVRTLAFARPAIWHNPDPMVTCVCGTDVNDTGEHNAWHGSPQRYRWKR